MRVVLGSDHAGFALRQHPIDEVRRRVRRLGKVKAIDATKETP
jgi:hypothetical protein